MNTVFWETTEANRPTQNIAQHNILHMTRYSSM